MQWKYSVKNTISKIIFSSPIAFFLGVGVFVATDVLQPSYFKNIPAYFPYFIAAMVVGYLAVFLASSYISTTKSKPRAVFFMLLFMAMEGLFSVLAVSTYYGSQEIPVLRIVSGLCLPLVFSLFYFLKIIEAEPVVKNVKELIDETDLFKNFDDLELSKPNF